MTDDLNWRGLGQKCRIIINILGFVGIIAILLFGWSVCVLPYPALP